MRDQIIMGPSGEVAIAIPLFRIHHDMELANLGGYHVTMTKNEPIAYALDMGMGPLQLCNKDLVDKNATFLGDL